VRELAKSVGSFSWALSLFGAQQVLSFVRPLGAGTQDPAAASFVPVTQATEEQLGSTFRNAFAAGEQVQRSAVDLAFGVLTLEVLDPNRLVALSTNVVRQSTSAVRLLLPGGAPANATTSTSSGCCQPCGWGPMPPAR
jgi:hypothetical protein